MEQLQQVLHFELECGKQLKIEWIYPIIRLSIYALLVSNKIEGIFNANFPQYKFNSIQRLTRGMGNENYRVDYGRTETSPFDTSPPDSIVITVYQDEQKWKLKNIIIVGMF